ncbi:MAG: amidohydrolase/deacetylase family metallohydrolase [Bryobacteraceae bacterium]|nr:amidohydrolase/deacetylase family metallohydrolase [Bryobacteraceae bacterium]MDW8377823.1 amidohydrolase/deacetylase family metallohydrolase [Bryobacterales bacterium]
MPRALFLALFAGLSLSGQSFDLLLKGARLIDPKNNIDAVRDIAIRGGRIAAVEAEIPASRARQSVDLKGLWITPGLVDIHVHLFHTTGTKDAWAGDNSVPPDAFSFRTGVTSMADAGSSGWRNFETFRHTVIDRARTRVFAFINIAGLGMMTDIAEQGDFDPEQVARLARKHQDVVVGVKTAHYQGRDWKSVDAALAAGRQAKIPVMVDFGYFVRERPYWQLVTERLRPGDISTHMFRGPVPYLDENGKLYSYLRKARERGVKFDVGHGGGSFVWRNAVPAIEQGFYPDSISTDLHTGSMNGPMFDMPTTMSKMLALGMPLIEVVRASTWNPAQLINHPELGHLSPGAVADIAVWRLLEGDFGFGDSGGGRIHGKLRLQCEMTLLNGRVVFDWNARLSSRDWKLLPKDYGVRDVDAIVPPPQH